MTSTMSGTDLSLRGLRDRPFELLKELEKRSRTVAAKSVAEADAGQEWVGVAFRMGGETFLAAREETREVLGYPAVVTRIPGAKNWVRGLANVRGALMPMLDLRQFLGSGATAILWTDAAGHDHKNAGPSLGEGDEGTLTVTFSSVAPAWNLHLLNRKPN